jgi:hypothetical protein
MGIRGGRPLSSTCSPTSTRPARSSASLSLLRRFLPGAAPARTWALTSVDASSIDLPRSADHQILKRPVKLRTLASAAAILAAPCVVLGLRMSLQRRREGRAGISRVCSKQYLALSVKAAFSRYVARIMPASIVERAVPTASLPPFRPFDVIAIFAVGVSRFPGRTKDALGGTAWTGDYLPGQRGTCQHRKKHCGNANQSDVFHSVLPLGCNA